MYRILTGLCCAVWCAVIAVEAFGLNKRQEMALDSFEMASCFNDEFTDDVTAQIRLYGTGPALTSEEEITEYLEGAAAVCQIYSGYGIIKKKETYGCIWELEGANEDFSWSLQKKKKNNDEDTNENQTAIKNDNMCEGLISWRFAGDWSEEMQRIYEKKERLEKYSQSQSKLCLELIGSWPQLMTKEQIDECAKKMINKAGASLVSAKGQDNLQLYYGYGEKLGEVIRFQNERSNINLLYRVNGEKTICILGFPTVQWDD